MKKKNKIIYISLGLLYTRFLFRFYFSRANAGRQLLDYYILLLLPHLLIIMDETIVGTKVCK